MISVEYLAGFFDGEGSVGIYGSKSSGRFSMRVSINQVLHTASLNLFDELLLRWGGSWSLIKNRSNKHRQAHLWQAYGDEAARFLQAIEPHLRLKTDQVRLILPWQLEYGSNRAHRKDPVRSAERAQKAAEIMKRVSELTSKGPKAFVTGRHGPHRS